MALILKASVFSSFFFSAYLILYPSYLLKYLVIIILDDGNWKCTLYYLLLSNLSEDDTIKSAVVFSTKATDDLISDYSTVKS